MAHSLSVLVADHEPLVRDRLRHVFVDRGFEVFVAESGMEAVDMARDVRVDLTVLEYDMPDLTGLEAFGLIRRMRRQALPTIFLTNNPSKELKIELLDEGVFSLVPKPIEERIFLESLRQLARRFFNSDFI